MKHVRYFLSISTKLLMFPAVFRKTFPVYKFRKTRTMGGELFHMGEQTLQH
jgi:hypothetical protein